MVVHDSSFVTANGQKAKLGCGFKSGGVRFKTRERECVYTEWFFVQHSIHYVLGSTAKESERQLESSKVNLENGIDLMFTFLIYLRIKLQIF